MHLVYLYFFLIAYFIEGLTAFAGDLLSLQEFELVRVERGYVLSSFRIRVSPLFKRRVLLIHGVHRNSWHWLVYLHVTAELVWKIVRMIKQRCLRDNVLAVDIVHKLLSVAGLWLDLLTTWKPLDKRELRIFKQKLLFCVTFILFQRPGCKRVSLYFLFLLGFLTLRRAFT